MKTSRWRDWFLNHFFKFVFAFICLSASLSFAGPARTTYQAKIVKPDGYPLEAANVNFRFTILDPSGTCILYTETYSSVDMSSSSGLISFALGSGVKTYPVSATTFEDVFSNITPTLSCDAGGPPSYSPAANDVRKIVMQFNDGPGWQTLPAMSINAVPYAMYANNAEKLAGKTDADFVQISTIPSCGTSEALKYNGASFSCVALGSGGGSVTSSTVITALGYTPADGVSVTALTSDVNVVSSTVASVSSTVASVSAAVTSLQNTVVASFSAITSSQWSDVASGISYSGGAVGIGTSAPLSSLHVNDGMFTMSDSSVSHPIPSTWLGFGDQTTFTSLRILSATSGGVRFSGISDSDATALQLDAYSGANAPTTPAMVFRSSKWNGAAATTSLASTETAFQFKNFNNAPLATILGGGKVGIGTTTPVTKLEVSGGVRISMESATCAVSYAGTLRYNAGNVEFCNGTTWAAFGVSGAGVQSFNGSTSGTQSFANALTGTTPAFVTNNGVHTLNIPMASEAATTAGLISNADYVNFSNKLSATSAAITATLGYTPADAVSVTTLSSVVASQGVSLTTLTSATEVNAASITTLANSTAASFSAITSSQWSDVASGISYSGGAVGIGTTSPAQALDVSGSVQVAGDFLFNNDPSSVFKIQPSTARATGVTNPIVLHSNINAASDTNGGSWMEIHPDGGVGVNNGGRVNITAYGQGTGANSNAIRLFTRSGSGTVTERMRVSSNGNVGIGTILPMTKLSVSGGVQISMESATCAVSYAGTLRYNAGNVEFCNGTTWAAFGVSGSGVQSFNGSTSGTQSFANALTGTTPAFVTANGVHTLNIPMASEAATTAGLISNADYVNFSNKLSATSAAITATLGYTPADAVSVTTLSSVVASQGVSLTTLTSATEVNAASITTLANSTAASFSAITSSQWITSGTTINYMAGNVGVGTSSPTRTLHVAATNLSTVPMIERSSAGTTGAYSTFDILSSTSADMTDGFGPATRFLIKDSANVENPIAHIAGVRDGADNSGSLLFSTYVSGVASLKMSITSSGNVGIASSTPGSKLVVKGSGITSATSSLNVTDSTNNSKFLIRDDGNVGIGTSSPARRLDVAGSINISGTAGDSSIYFPSSTSTNYPGVVWNDDNTGAGSLISHSYLGNDTDFGQSWLFNAYQTGNAAATYLKRLRSSYTPSRLSMSAHEGGFIYATASSGSSGTDIVDWQTRFIIKSTGRVGIGTSSPVTALEVSGGVRISMESATCAVSYAGTLRYNAGNVEFCNGTTWAAFGVSGAGITSFNGSTSGTQSFANALTGTTPAFVTNNGVHTLNIPYASEAATTAGLISNAEYVNFSNKLSATSAAVVSVLGYTPADAVSVTTLTSATEVNAASITALTNSTAASFAAITSSQWTTSGTAIYYNTGNVGIGTSAPVTKLDVSGSWAAGQLALGSVGNGGIMLFRRGTDGTFQNSIGSDSATGTAFVIKNSGGSGEIRLNSSASTGFVTAYTSATERLRIDQNGNVGIGTSTPASPLEVNGDITATGGPGALNLKADVNDHTYIQFFARSATPGTRSGFFGYPSSGTIHMNLFNEISSGSLVFGTSGTERLRIDSSGNIGVGYSAPTAKLQLAAGTSSLAPLKFTSGTLLSSPQIGTMEYDGFNFYLTDGGGTRRTIATGSGSGSIDNASVINSSGNMSLVPVGSVIVSSTTASTDSQTGALVVNGGLGVAGNIYSSGTIVTSSNIQGASITATSGMISPYIAGSIVSGGSLTLDSTTHANKGNILLAVNGGNVGIGTSTPSALLEVSGTSNLLASFGSGPSSQTNYIEMNSRAYFGYNGVTNNAVVQGISSKGIEFNVNSMTFGSGTAMVINSSGNVGIGTTSPGSTAVKSFNKVVDLVSTTDNAIQGYSIRNSEGTNNRRVGFFLDDSAGTYGLDSTATTGLAEFVLQVAGAEKVRLTNSGNMGIGVSAPTLPLHVYSAANHVANFDSGYNTAGSGAGIFIRNTASGGVSAGNKRMIYFSANDTTNTMYNTAYIQARAETAAGVGDIPTALDFGTGSSTASTRMTINASGNVGIGTTAPTARLSVSKTVVGADNEIVTLQNAVPWSSTSGYMQQLIWRDHSNIAGAIGLKYNSSGATVDFTINSLYNGGAYQPSSNIPFIVRGNGNVGIGTSSPVERLDFGTCGGATPCNFKFGNWSYLGTGAAGYPYLSFGTVWDGAQWNTTHTTVSGMMIRTNATGMLFESAPANTAGASLTYRLFISNSTGNVGVGTVVPVTKLEVAGGVKISMESAACAVSYAGTLRYNAGNVEFCNGSTWAAFGVAGSGVTSFNGSTSGTQSLAFGTAGTSPGFSTANGVHTLNIPYASEATTTAGLISNAEYTSFSNKIASSAASIAEVLGYVPAASGAVSSQWSTSGTAIFYNTGNVGIGTSAPTTTLHLVTSQPTGFILERSSSAANSNIQFKSQSGSMYAGLSDSNNFGIGSTNSLSSATLTVTTTGNVGIGTISPGSKLHVVGDEIRISGSGAPSGGGVDRLAFGSVDGSYKWIQSYGTQPLALNPISNNVGIGTTTPTAKLQISGNGAGADGLLHLSSTSGNADGALVRLGPYAYLNTSANGSSYWNWGSRYDGATDTWVRTYTSLDSYLPYIRSHVDTITIGGAVSNLTTDSNPTMQDRVTFNLATGNIGIGITAPTAKLHIVSGTSSLAPLKFTSGTLLSSAQPGAMEYDGFNFFITDGASVRRTIATQSSAGVYDSVSAINNSSGNISLTPQSAGSVIVSSTAASTNSSTGALIVNGGMGVVGNIYSSGTIITSSNMQGASLTATSGMITPYIFGSTVSGGSLTLDSTTHGNKGSITIGSSATAVGVGGAPSTTAKLKVSGTIAGNTNVIASGGSVNLALSNIHILQSVGSASIALSNFENGGVYTIIVSDTTARTYTFSGCTNSYFNPTNGSTTDAARTIYGITAINTGGSNYDCYITWSSGFQ